MHLNKTLRALTLLLIGASSSAIFAASDTQSVTDFPYNQHGGLYFGAVVGPAIAVVKDQNSATTGGIDGLGGSAFLGYQFNPYVALGADFTGYSSFFMSTYMYGVTVRGILPLGNRFDLYAKAGVGNVVFSIEDVFAPGTSISMSSVKALVGAGASVALTHQLSLILDYSGAAAVEHTASGVVGVLGLGLRYNFS